MLRHAYVNFLVDPDCDVGEDSAVLGEVEVPQALLNLLRTAPSLRRGKLCCFNCCCSQFSQPKIIVFNLIIPNKRDQV